MKLENEPMKPCAKCGRSFEAIPGNYYDVDGERFCADRAECSDASLTRTYVSKNPERVLVQMPPIMNHRHQRPQASAAA
jgi:hypothetical protein